MRKFPLPRPLFFGADLSPRVWGRTWHHSGRHRLQKRENWVPSAADPPGRQQEPRRFLSVKLCGDLGTGRSGDRPCAPGPPRSPPAAASVTRGRTRRSGLQRKSHHLQIQPNPPPPQTQKPRLISATPPHTPNALGGNLIHHSVRAKSFKY